MPQATQEQINAWKGQHGDVWQIRIEPTDKQMADYDAAHPDDAGAAPDNYGYLKRPDRKTISYASSIAAKDPLRFNEIMMKNCWVGGDEVIMTDDVLFVSAGQVLGKLVEVKEAEMVKL